ncbi:hypothetical protein L798_11743 [Zootermopsis nevadensis]|uniref:Transposable element Tc3 transposase n=1 Tax=Zootermopsis nevadensis TaxID=136037 RepID=A0A067QVY0_ZOONE|nr:hypothetical protein L798_11743 [Zootermopsis nevadensis]
MYGPQFRVTESLVHFSSMKPLTKIDTKTCWKTVGLPMQTQWFMQDGARPHTANMVLDFLHETFDLRVISHRFPERHEGGKMWPPHSPDINLCDFFMWGFFKEKVYQRRPENVVQLRACIVQLCCALSEDLCRKVVMNTRVHLQVVVRQNGGHIEHVIH